VAITVGKNSSGDQVTEQSEDEYKPRKKPRYQPLPLTQKNHFSQVLEEKW